MLFYRLSGSLAALSFCGAIVVIFSYCSMAVLRKHPTNMVFFLSVSDLLFSLKFIVTALYPGSDGLVDKQWTCFLQAGWAQFWGMASISWVGMISLNLIFELHKQGFARTASYGKYYHGFVWSISALTTLIMFFGKHKIGSSIGPSGDGTCWVQRADDPFKLLFFVPLLVYFVISIYTVVLATIRTSNGVMSDASRRGVMLRMALYVAVFLLCWSMPLIHRIDKLVNKNDEDPRHPKPLQLLDAIGISIQGFANAMVWLSNPSFFVAFKKNVLDKYFGCIFKDNTEKHPLLSEIESGLADSRQDITVIGQILRRNIITCILLGIQRSMQDLVRSDVTQKNYSETKKYTPDELAGDESEGPSQAFEFLDFSPLVFAHIRELSKISMETYKDSMNVAQFLGKLTNEQLAKFSDGRSDSFFIFSPDKKFILKTISAVEAKVLLKMLPSLHHYFRANPHSLITRFYGCHAVRVSHGDLVHVVVMGNVFSSPMAIHECYDLKGSWVNRSAGIRPDPSKLGMDLDFTRKLRLDPAVKSMFLDQLQKDALLLCSLNIMDYSLLLGLHFVDRDESTAHTSLNGVELVQFINTAPPDAGLSTDKLPGAQGLTQLVSLDRTEIYCVGIIDVLQLYDRKKKMERFAKVYILQKDGQGLSSMAPQPYAKRFANAMRNITNF